MTVKEQGKLFQGGRTMESINNVAEQCFSEFEKKKQNESRFVEDRSFSNTYGLFCHQKLRIYEIYKLRHVKPST